MNPTHDATEASYAFCRRMSRRAGSNFHAGFLLLPRRQRRAMWALYAFMRHTDDLADQCAPHTPCADGGTRREALAAWRTALQQAVQGDGSETEPRGLGTSVPSLAANNSGLRVQGSASHQVPNPESKILPALADAVAEFHIPPEHLFAVLDGVEMDLDRRRYETFDQLRQYCDRVASAVGLCCIHIWGFRGPAAFAPARQAGIALQLTNILRDLKEDAAAGRVYLPIEDLRLCGYSADDLLAGVADQRFRRLMAMEVARAEQFYADGAELLDWLAPPGRRMFGLLMATYRALLNEIARHPADVFRRRVRTGRLKKLRLLARWSLLPPRKGDLQ